MNTNWFWYITFPVLLLIAWNFEKVKLEDVAPCKDYEVYYRMTGKILKSIRVYTALQCKDKCFRTNSCNGINLNTTKNSKKEMICELVESDAASSFVFEKNWAHIRVKGEELRKLWVSESL